VQRTFVRRIEEHTAPPRQRDEQDPCRYGCYHGRHPDRCQDSSYFVDAVFRSPGVASGVVNGLKNYTFASGADVDSDDMLRPVTRQGGSSSGRINSGSMAADASMLLNRQKTAKVLSNARHGTR
jgi:hypothetical protein